ncbi:hypothetical protein D9758_006622 [Tetrapyrgos nigripes]|uniref:F-box domain-containing protein n=1 Tax=Tetrapyrgos nigripes TaxID=182062 RepID=A0A8H5GJG3_9AGAR|nr:hypothetical protein D9758_006622 [Tetrapyrgos nigripes]
MAPFSSLSINTCGFGELSPELVDRILSHLSTDELYRISRVCRFLKMHVDALLLLLFWFLTLYTLFFEDNHLPSLQRVQFRTCFIVSGSVVLQFLLCERWSNLELDLYVQSRYAHDVGVFLESCGYRYEARPGQKSSFQLALQVTRDIIRSYDRLHSHHGIDAVFDFRKGSLTVQLVACVRSVFDVLMSFHSTVVQNFATFEAVYSLFPRATFLDKVTLLTFPPGLDDAECRAAIAKYGEKKRKASDESEFMPGPPTKKSRIILDAFESGPLGFIWDSQNFSCGYDSILTILTDMWSVKPSFWTKEWSSYNAVIDVSIFACAWASRDVGLKSHRNSRFTSRSVHDFFFLVDPSDDPSSPLDESSSLSL